MKLRASSLLTLLILLFLLWTGLLPDGPAPGQPPSSPGGTPEQGGGAPPRPGVLAGKVVAVDAGHGGGDWGAVGPSGTLEKWNTLEIARRLKRLLEAAGARVVMTRDGDYEPRIDVVGDSDPERLLGARVDIAREAGAHVFVSIHNDANANRAIQRTTTYYYMNPTLARELQRAVVEAAGTRDLGIRQEPFVVLRWAARYGIPAALVEVAFISNPEEEQLLVSDWFRDRVAQGLYNGLVRYLTRPS